ncbi:hypothetical protein QR680_015776 [Steinernema hermaphroditum]|uniref:Uncharacterized protein n=1 Tax=Steinernema hermaphroditum TaxID=289476 RepID=A0AA39HB29_9BILA|nr:hypothetical protein QR680_015776 [Steinernema hermaphroditum]
MLALAPSSNGFQPDTDTLREVQGVLLISVVVISLPPYLRILYIFITRSDYRKIECYQIMIQMGIVQCLLAPGVFCQGLMQLLNYDPYQMASITIKSYPSIQRMEPFMGLVLAFNRLRIICNVRYPSSLNTVVEYETL